MFILHYFAIFCLIITPFHKKMDFQKKGSIALGPPLHPLTSHLEKHLASNRNELPAIHSAVSSFSLDI